MGGETKEQNLEAVISGIVRVKENPVMTLAVLEYLVKNAGKPMGDIAEVRSFVCRPVVVF